MRLEWLVPVLIVALPLCAADDAPRVVHICTVAPNIIAVTIDEGRVEYGRQIPYKSHPKDEVNRTEGKARTVRRDGTFIGSLVAQSKLVVGSLVRP